MTAAETATFVAQQQTTWLPVLQGISQARPAK
jgi:hypothetical protein